MKNGLWIVMVTVVGSGAPFGCAQQQLGGGAPDGGPGNDAGCGPPVKLACSVPNGCGTPTVVAPICLDGSWTCPANVGVTQSCEPPVCPAALNPGCSCDPATGLTSCTDAGVCGASAPAGSIGACVRGCTYNSAVSATCDGGVWSCPAGTIDVRTCVYDAGGARDASGAHDAGSAHDAGAGCLPNGQDGSFLQCTSTCNIDSSPVTPACVNGSWTCPSPSRDVRTCCHGTAPAGCKCDPLSGVLVCSVSGG